MGTQSTAGFRLERAVDAAEQFLLQATDEDILRAGPGLADSAHREVKALIAQRIGSDSREAAHAVAPRSQRHPPRRKQSRSNPLASFLKQLAVVRPDLSPQLQTTFEAGKDPSQAEIEELAIELLKSRLK